MKKANNLGARSLAQAWRNLKDERASVLILTALSISMLLSFFVFAIDIGSMFYTQRQLQTLADAAALAGALEVSSCAGTAHCTVMQTAASSAMTEGGSATPTLYLQCATASGTGLMLTLNNGPCALGAGDPNNGDTNYVEAVVTLNQATLFGKLMGASTVKISARAEAGKSASTSPCLIVTGTTGQTVTFNTGTVVTDITGSTCGIQVNSSSAGAVMENTGTVTVGSYNVVGTVTHNAGTYTPSPTTGAASVADPYAAEITAGTLVTPTTSGLTTQSTSLVTAATTLNPGYYASGLTCNPGTYTVTLNPGVYYMGSNVIVDNGVTISGSGVTIYMAGTAQLNMNTGTDMRVTAPTTGGTAGLVIWAASGNTSGMNLNSASNSSWSGGIYVPSGALTLNGGSNAAAYGSIVAKSLTVNAAISLGTGTSGTGSGNGSTTISLAE